MTDKTKSESAILPLLINKEARDDLSGEAPRALALRPQLVAIEIRGPEDEQFLSDVMAQVKSKIAEIEAKRKTISGPLDQAKKAVDALFRPAREAYEGLEALIKQRLGEAETARRLAAQQALATARALAATGDLQGSALALPVPTEKPLGVQYVETWEHERVDLMALVKAVAAGRAPLEFVRWDDSAVKIWLRTYKNSCVVPEIPGLAFERKTSVRAAQ